MSDQEMGDLLRSIDFTLDRAATALIAFGDRKYADAIDRDYQRINGIREEIKRHLADLPPAVPLTAEQEAKAAAVIGAVLNKRFGDGTQAEVDTAIAAMVDGPEKSTP